MLLQLLGFLCSTRESTGLGGPLNEEEFHVIQGMLDLGRKKGLKAMTPLENVGAQASGVGCRPKQQISTAAAAAAPGMNQPLRQLHAYNALLWWRC